MSGKPMLIFDLDGTLWDSAANVAVSWNIVFRREYPSLPDLTKEDIHSVTLLIYRVSTSKVGRLPSSIMRVMILTRA